MQTRRQRLVLDAIDVDIWEATLPGDLVSGMGQQQSSGPNRVPLTPPFGRILRRRAPRLVAPHPGSLSSKPSGLVVCHVFRQGVVVYIFNNVIKVAWRKRPRSTGEVGHRCMGLRGEAAAIFISSYASRFTSLSPAQTQYPSICKRRTGLLLARYETVYEAFSQQAELSLATIKAQVYLHPTNRLLPRSVLHPPYRS